MHGVNSWILDGAPQWRRAMAAAGLTALMTAGSAGATNLSLQIGDEDCFGVGGACAPGSLVALGAITAGAGDPAGTDALLTSGAQGFTFNLSLAGPVTSASLTMRLLGLDLNNLTGVPETALLDGVVGAWVGLENAGLAGVEQIGLLSDLEAATTLTPAFQPGEVVLWTFAFDGALLANGANTVTVFPEDYFVQFQLPEDYAVDFVRLEYAVNDDPTTVVPLPAPALLLAAALGALGIVRRKR